ncbi:MAG: DNA primase [Rhodoferax sp.]
MAIPESFIQELVARADIAEVIGRYVPLKKGGANLMGLCPFHGEKSPSFSVSPSKQFFHCFGCGKNGNVIGFLMEHTGMGFVEAVHDLAQQYGMQVPQDQASPQERERAQRQRSQQTLLVELLEKASQAYQKQLRGAPRAVEYLKGRGLTGAVAKHFGLGYAPAGWRHLASVFPHYDDPQLVESGLVLHSAEEGGQEQKRYDRFRDRIMFPIRNTKGQCIGFGGRVLGDDKPKYLNSPETPVFSKGTELYGLFEARQAIREAGYVLVTEGYMDVVALAQHGFGNAVATLGTACTPDHVRKLFQHTEAVVFSFDGDAAGRRAARKALDGALPYANDTRSIKFLFLPPEHDPDSFVRAHGKDAFGRFVLAATPLSQFLVDSCRDGCDLALAEGRARLASQAQALWSALPNGALKLQLLAELADLVQLSPRELQSLWDPRGERPTGRTRRSKAPAGGEAPGARAFAPPSPAPAPQGAPKRVRGSAVVARADVVARTLARHPDLWLQLSNEDHSLLCALGEPYGPLFAAIDDAFLVHGEQAPGQLAVHALSAQASDWVRQLQHTGLVAADARARMQELRDALNRMLIEHLKEQQTQAIAAAATDPGALQRYQALQTRRLQLEQSVQAAVAAQSS